MSKIFLNRKSNVLIDFIIYTYVYIITLFMTEIEN